MLITISGLPGSGTTTVSKLLSKAHNVEFVSVGDLFRKIAKEKNLSVLEFNKLAEKDNSIDFEIDEYQKKVIKTMNTGILEGRLSGHFANKMSKDVSTIRIWIKAPIEIRAKRIAKRKSISYDDALSEIIEREKSECARYKTIYEMDINNLSIYDIIIDSNGWKSHDIMNILKKSIDCFNKRIH